MHDYLTRVYCSGSSALTEKAIYRACHPCVALIRWYRKGCKANPVIKRRSLNLIRMIQHSTRRISVEPSDFDTLVIQHPPARRASEIEGPKFRGESSSYRGELVDIGNRKRSEFRGGEAEAQTEEIITSPGNFEIHKGKVELVVR